LSPSTLTPWLGAVADVTSAPVTNGHTNDSFFVTAGDARFVWRRSWRGKPAAQLAREAALLDALAEVAVPQLVSTLDGQRAIVDDEGRVAQLFRRCAGEPGPRWLRADDVHRVRAAMTRLAELHRALATLPSESPASPTPATADAPLHWLRARYDRVVALVDSAASAPAALPDGAAKVLARIDGILSLAPSPSRPSQWLHGDYHLGNLLWNADGQIAAVVDFDDCDRGAAASEAALALLALARRPDDDAADDFAFHRPLWDAGLAAYRAIAGPIAPYDDLALALPLFCAYQVLIHCEASLRRHWSPAPGIGFWPCWNRLSGR
jgi:Ser/Thr protein kinase RdoA (MazF antagonist)